MDRCVVGVLMTRDLADRFKAKSGNREPTGGSYVHVYHNNSYLDLEGVLATGLVGRFLEVVAVAFFGCRFLGTGFVDSSDSSSSISCSWSET